MSYRNGALPHHAMQKDVEGPAVHLCHAPSLRPTHSPGGGQWQLRVVILVTFTWLVWPAWSTHSGEICGWWEHKVMMSRVWSINYSHIIISNGMGEHDVFLTLSLPPSLSLFFYPHSGFLAHTAPSPFQPAPPCAITSCMWQATSIHFWLDSHGAMIAHSSSWVKDSPVWGGMIDVWLLNYDWLNDWGMATKLRLIEWLRYGY